MKKARCGSCFLATTQSMRWGMDRQSQRTAEMLPGPVVGGFLHLAELHSQPVVQNSLGFWFLLSVSPVVMVQGEKWPKSSPYQKPQRVSPLYSSHSMNTITKASFFFFKARAWEALHRSHVAGLRLQAIALVAQGAAGTWCDPGALGAPCKGQLAGSDGPSALGACRRAACMQPSLCLVQVGAKGVGATGQPWRLSHPRWGRGLKVAGLGGEGGQKRWRKGGGWCFPAHVDYDLSLGRRRVSTAIADDFFLQLKPHIRPRGASWCNGEQLGLHSS